MTVKKVGNSNVSRKDAESARTDDLACVRAARRGDRAAFETLFRKYRKRIYHVVHKYVFNADDALDVTQDVFLKTYKSLDTFKEDANFYTWLCRIAINKAIDHLRTRRARKTVSFEILAGEDEAMPPLEGSPDEAPAGRAELAELRRAVAKAISELPDYHRDVIVLNADEELSYKEIAKVLDISAGTVMSRLFYARQALREKLKNYL